MLRQVRRVVLGAFLALIVFAGSVAAECAWVLWDGFSKLDPEEAEQRRSELWSWSVRDAFGSREGCTEEQTKIISRWTKDQGTASGKDFSVSMSLSHDRKASLIRENATGKSVLTTQRVVCLPETVDPRARKD